MVTTVDKCLTTRALSPMKSTNPNHNEKMQGLNVLAHPGSSRYILVIGTKKVRAWHWNKMEKVYLLKAG